MSIQHINPTTIAPPRGYSHAVKNGNTVGVGDARAQMEQVFQNIEAVLAAAGGNLSHIVKTTTFMTHREDIPIYREMRAKYLLDPNPPASTLILCSGLADPAFRIEIEAIAIVP